MLEHEVHGLPDRLHLGGLLVGHLDPVGVLELLHERVEVERVGLQVALEVGLLGHPRRVDLQLVGQVGADQLEDFVAGHDWSGKVAAAPDTIGGAVLLGLRHLGVVPHGSFGARGFASAIEVAARGVREDVLGRTHERLAEAGALRRAADPSAAAATVPHQS